MDQQQSLQKTMVGVVTSDKMEKTVVVKVTTFKVHRLYHKRYRWTKKYLSDVGSLEPRIGDTVKIVSGRPMSKLKRWTVAEILTSGDVQQVKQARKDVAKAKTVKASASKKKSK
jgi:small subunit ribosomal protein S17